MINRFTQWRAERSATRSRILTPGELTAGHWSVRSALRSVRVFMAAMLVGGILFYASASRNDSDLNDQGDDISAQATKQQATIDRLEYVIAQQNYDRCVSGNNFRKFSVDNNAGFVGYIDTLLQGLSSLGPNPATLTPDEQRKALEYARIIADARHAQLDKNNDPALAQRPCPDPPTPPRSLSAGKPAAK